MGADADMVKGALLAFEDGSALDKADRAHRQAAHIYSRASKEGTPQQKQKALDHFRRTAILFVAAAQDAVAGKAGGA